MMTVAYVAAHRASIAAALVSLALLVLAVGWWLNGHLQDKAAEREMRASWEAEMTAKPMPGYDGETYAYQPDELGYAPRPVAFEYDWPESGLANYLQYDRGDYRPAPPTQPFQQLPSFTAVPPSMISGPMPITTSMSGPAPVLDAKYDTDMFIASMRATTDWHIARLSEPIS